MRFRLAVEDIEPGHWVACVLDLPGCYSSWANLADAVAQAPDSIAHHFDWLAARGVLPEMDLLPIETAVTEQFTSYPHPDDPDYIVNAFFENDRRPPGFWDVENALRLMSWTREELLALQPDVQCTASLDKEKFPAAANILRHIAIAENWYLDRLDMGLARPSLPDNPWEMQATVRANAQAQLVQLIGDSRIVEKSGETWSARKIMRRLLWHEQDHTRQLSRVLR